jgi:hypothetical protein
LGTKEEVDIRAADGEMETFNGHPMSENSLLAFTYAGRYRECPLTSIDQARDAAAVPVLLTRCGSRQPL